MLDERVGAWINLEQAARVIQNLLEERLQAAAGLSGPEFELLWRLEVTAGKQLQMNEIANQLLASKSGITRLVERLEAKGLLVRQTPADNRRVVHARLTSTGEAALIRARAAFMAGLDDAFSAHLSDGEVQSMRRMLRKLLTRNGAWAEARCSPSFGEHGQARDNPAATP